MEEVPDAARDFSEVALTTPAFDVVATEAPRIKFAIMSSPRSGSFLLCRLLTRLGVGVPHEYFNVIHDQVLAERWNVAPTDYYDELLRRRTVNGIFGVKVQWQQMVDRCPISDDEFCRDYRVIYLYRRRLKRQAASLHFARVTGQWDSGDVVTTPPSTERDLLDPEGVHEALEVLLDEEIGFRRYFASHDMWPLFIAYEELIEDRVATLTRVLDYIGVDVDSVDLTVPGEPYRPPSSEKQAQQKLILQEFLAVAALQKWDGRSSPATKTRRLGALKGRVRNLQHRVAPRRKRQA